MKSITGERGEPLRCVMERSRTQWRRGSQDTVWGQIEHIIDSEEQDECIRQYRLAGKEEKRRLARVWADDWEERRWRELQRKAWRQGRVWWARIMKEESAQGVRRGVLAWPMKECDEKQRRVVTMIRYGNGGHGWCCECWSPNEDWETHVIMECGRTREARDQLERASHTNQICGVFDRRSHVGCTTSRRPDTDHRHHIVLRTSRSRSSKSCTLPHCQSSCMRASGVHGYTSLGRRYTYFIF
jgi:hypothetical protein